MKKIFLWLLLGLGGMTAGAQQNDSLIIKAFFDEALRSDFAYRQLEYLCKNIGGRICCSPEAAAAVEWSKQLLESLGADTVYLQPCTVRCWKRGEKEKADVFSRLGTFSPEICALGGSVGTGPDGIRAEVIEVKSLEELKTLGTARIKGKIVFFNRPAEPTFINTFASYGSAADQRVHGASAAAGYGAVGVIVRSLTLAHDDAPHTGIMDYEPGTDSIPAVAIGTRTADQLSQWLSKDPTLQLFFRTTCTERTEGVSYNVIAEKFGREHPEEIICFGGHIDAWDNGEGAHDDGVGVMHNIEALRLLLHSNYQPRNTLRVIVFMDEEIDQRGAAAYASSVKEKGEKILAAIESDRGGFTPTGWSFDAGPAVERRLNEWKPLLLQYGLYSIIKGYSGVDIYPLKKMGIPLFAIMTDSQRYFDYQHAGTDHFEAVNRREMQLGAASIAMLVYLIDRYGWE